MYHHRGAYLNAIGNALTWEMPRHPVYLWTLPMFHCNGWCFPWTVTMLAGTHVCLRKVEARAVLDLMNMHGVTHLCGAPIVMGMLINAPGAAPRNPRVKMMTAGAAPPAAVVGSMESLGFDVTHTYGADGGLRSDHRLRMEIRVEQSGMQPSARAFVRGRASPTQCRKT